MDNHFGGAIWTTHALERLGQRGLSRSMAAEAFQNPDIKTSGNKPGSIEFQKRFGSSQVSIIAKKNERDEWIILSCWIEPPLAGSQDSQKRKKYLILQKASTFRKILRMIKQQLFG